MTQQTKKYLKIAIYCLLGIMVIVIVDRVIMPWYVNLGKEIQMPKVTDLSAAEAAQILNQQHFEVIFQDSMFSAIHPVGTVIDQNPYATAMVKTGRRVYLTISIGEKPVIMPDLIGKSPRNAELLLKSAGLRLGRTEFKSSSLVPARAVAEQSYPAGQELKPGTLVSIKVSTGQNLDVLPDFRSLSLNDVKMHLEKLGLRVGNIAYEERNDILPETVISQTPEAGAPFQSGEYMDLVVSKLPADE